MDKFDEYDESVVKKPNRRRKLEPKTHATIIGGPPLSGIHTEERKEADKKSNLAVKKAIR